MRGYSILIVAFVFFAVTTLLAFSKADASTRHYRANSCENGACNREVTVPTETLVVEKLRKVIRTRTDSVPPPPAVTPCAPVITSTPPACAPEACAPCDAPKVGRKHRIAHIGKGVLKLISRRR